MGPSAICCRGTRPKKRPEPAVYADVIPPVPDVVGAMQVKVWLLGIGPMVWRRVLVRNTDNSCELHGMGQIAMGEASKGSDDEADGKLTEAGRVTASTSSAFIPNGMVPGRIGILA